MTSMRVYFEAAAVFYVLLRTPDTYEYKVCFDHAVTNSE